MMSPYMLHKGDVTTATPSFFKELEVSEVIY